MSMSACLERAASITVTINTKNARAGVHACAIATHIFSQCGMSGLMLHLPKNIRSRCVCRPYVKDNWSPRTNTPPTILTWPLLCQDIRTLISVRVADLSRIPTPAGGSFKLRLSGAFLRRAHLHCRKKHPAAVTQKFKSPAGQAGLGKMPVGTLPFKQLYYSKHKQVEKPCGGRRTRTVIADLATRLLERQRPVPTGNVLQTQPIARSVFPLP